MEFGLKLGSIDESLLGEARRLYDKKVFNFLELYVVPGSFEEVCKSFSKIKMPCVVHAPHFGHGCNLSLRENFRKNRMLFEEAKKFAHLLNAKFIILHLGTRGTLEESMRQLKELSVQDFPIVIENKPQIALDGTSCVGVSPSDIQKVKETCSAGFCLDIGHAIAYATFHRLDYRAVLHNFLKLSPILFHLCDSFHAHVKDMHKNLGEGDFDFKEIFEILPKKGWITLETPKGSKKDLTLFAKEVAMLQRLRYT